MTSGRLVKSKGKYFVVMYWRDNYGKRVEKWISTKLDIEGNTNKAKRILIALKSGFQPGDIVKTNLVLLRLGLNPIQEDMSRMKKLDVQKKIREESASDSVAEVAQNLQNGLILFSDFMKIWLDKVRPEIKPTTYTGYHFNIYNIIDPYFRKKRIYLQDITPEDLEQFYAEMLKTRNPNTVIRFHANIRKALQYAFKKGFILTNVADRAEKPKKKEFVHSYYNKEEIDALLEKAKGTPLEFPIFMASYYGLRREEIVGLKWDAIDFQYRKFTIKHTVTAAVVDGKRVEIGSDTTKTKKSFRSLPFDKNGIIENMLLGMKVKQDEWRKTFGDSYNHEFDDYIYVRENGDRYKVDWLTENFASFLEKNQFRKIRFHDLRHSCATMLRHIGIRMEDIQKYLGHSTITTTEGIYAHFDEEQNRVSVDSLSDYILNIDKKKDKQMD
jgi:integrase